MEHACHVIHVECACHGVPVEVWSLPPCAFWSLNSPHLAWWPTPLSTEPSLPPTLVIFFIAYKTTVRVRGKCLEQIKCSSVHPDLGALPSMPKTTLHPQLKRERSRNVSVQLHGSVV